jgi:5-methylcytosine-specific restriction endonuclease McrA
MQRVFVLDHNRQPLDPCHPARARQLLKAGRAAVFRRQPFSIVLRDRTMEESVTHPHRVKLDPGSKTTGIALVQEETSRVVWAGEVQHRGEVIKHRLLARRALRRGRRNRTCRYRAPRFQNRRRPAGWLPPSLQSRVENTLTWVRRLRKYAPVGAISVELAKFDTQKLQDPDISGIEYQQGELAGYEVRQYVLEKWGHRCAYCGARDVPLEVEHIVPKSRGGSDRVSNLALACRACNERKGNRTAAEFGHPAVQERAKRSLQDAAAINSTRWALWRVLTALGLPVEVGTGGRTKYNRSQRNLPKAHWLDAACVGPSGAGVYVPRTLQPLIIRARGQGKRQRCVTDRFGFPICHARRQKRYLGFQTGDLVRAVVPRGKYAGRHMGRVVIRHRPSFQLNGFNVHPRNLALLQCADGYEYGAGDSWGPVYPVA